MSYHSNGLGALHGLGQLTMDPQTVALLNQCTDKCEQQYGVASGAPNVLGLTSCFAQCNLQYPPTVAVPGIPPVTPPSVSPGVPSPETVPAVVPGLPTPTPGTPPGITAPPVTTQEPTEAGMSDTKMWVIGGITAVAVIGVALYMRKR